MNCFKFLIKEDTEKYQFNEISVIISVYIIRLKLECKKLVLSNVVDDIVDYAINFYFDIFKNYLFLFLPFKISALYFQFNISIHSI